MKKLFVLSDIHGFYDQMTEALRAAGYDPENESHLLVFCGDMTDRGPKNAEVIRFFDRLERKVLIRGNHEDMLLDLFRVGRLESFNYHNGTDITVRELFGRYSVDFEGCIDFSGGTGELDRVTDLIGGMRDYFETRHYVFTHGWLPVAKNGRILPHWRRASSAEWNAARWIRWTDVYGLHDRLPDKILVCGHHPTCYIPPMLVPDRDPLDPDVFVGDRFIAIDAGTVRSGQVNVLVLEDELLDE